MKKKVLKVFIEELKTKVDSLFDQNMSEDITLDEVKASFAFSLL